MPAIGIDLKGRIPAGEQASGGPCAGSAFGHRPGRSAASAVRRRGGWAGGSADAPARPAGVVTVDSYTRPQLIESLGARIAEVGRMPLLGRIGYVNGVAPERIPRSNSAQRLRTLHGAGGLGTPASHPAPRRPPTRTRTSANARDVGRTRPENSPGGRACSLPPVDTEGRIGRDSRPAHRAPQTVCPLA